MIGPRWDFQRIANFIGNSAGVCEERYTHLAEWADEYKGMEIEEIIMSARKAPAANFERRLIAITGAQRSASDFVSGLAN